MLRSFSRTPKHVQLRFELVAAIISIGKEKYLSRTLNAVAIFSPQYYGCLGLFILILAILEAKMELDSTLHRGDLFLLEKSQGKRQTKFYILHAFFL